MRNGNCGERERRERAMRNGRGITETKKQRERAGYRRREKRKKRIAAERAMRKEEKENRFPAGTVDLLPGTAERKAVFSARRAGKKRQIPIAGYHIGAGAWAKHFRINHRITKNGAFCIGEKDRIADGNIAQLSEMGTVVVRSNHQIVFINRAEIAAGSNAQIGAAEPRRGDRLAEKREKMPRRESGKEIRKGRGREKRAEKRKGQTGKSVLSGVCLISFLGISPRGMPF